MEKPSKENIFRVSFSPSLLFLKEGTKKSNKRCQNLVLIFSQMTVAGLQDEAGSMGVYKGVYKAEHENKETLQLQSLIFFTQVVSTPF